MHYTQRYAYKQKARSPLDNDMNTKKSRDVGNFVAKPANNDLQDNSWPDHGDPTSYAPMDEYPALPRSTPPQATDHNRHVPVNDQVNTQSSPRK